MLAPASRASLITVKLIKAIRAARSALIEGVFINHPDVKLGIA
jgi:hypothetical protein